MVGDIMPADVILVEGNGIKMDESALTGESDTMKKESFNKCVELFNKDNKGKIPSPLILSGTNCVEGTGFAIVLAVGDHSQKGLIKRTVDNAQENNQTPLEIKLGDIIYRVNDKVIHNIFGEGVVVANVNDILTIAFAYPHGVKKIASSFKGIRKKKVLLF